MALYLHLIGLLFYWFIFHRKFISTATLIKILTSAPGQFKRWPRFQVMKCQPSCLLQIFVVVTTMSASVEHSLWRKHELQSLVICSQLMFHKPVDVSCGYNLRVRLGISLVDWTVVTVELSCTTFSSRSRTWGGNVRVKLPTTL